MISNEKRQLIEDWLNALCQDCEILASMEDDYHPGEYTKEIDEILSDAQGFINFVQYEPGSDEWENFDPEGYVWTRPNDAQLESLYPKALKWREEYEQE